MIGYMIGIIVAVVIWVFLSGRGNDRLERKIPRWLSKDKAPERYLCGWIIYANGTRWYIEVVGRYKLQWIPESNGNAETQIQNPGLIEYECTWLPEMEMYNHIRQIIYTHPNLEAPNLYWQIVKSLR